MLLIMLCRAASADAVGHEWQGPPYCDEPLHLTDDGAADLLDSVIERVRVIGLSISPDGKHYAASLIRADRAGDCYRSTLIVGTVSQPGRILWSTSAGRPRWYPSGEALWRSPLWAGDSRSFLHAMPANGLYQLFRFDLPGGKPTQVTTESGDVFDYRATADGPALAVRVRGRNASSPVERAPIRVTDTMRFPPRAGELVDLSAYEPDQFTYKLLEGSATRDLAPFFRDDEPTMPEATGVDGQLVHGSCSSAADTLLCVQQTPTNAGRIVRFRRGKSKIDVVLNLNAQLDAALRPFQVSFERFQAAAGAPRAGYVVRKRHSPRQPAIVYVYYQPGGFLEGNGEDASVFDLASRGFTVIALHTPARRTPDSDVAEALLDWSQPIEVATAALCSLQSQGVVDAARSGFIGWSYGSEIGLYAATHGSMFKATVTAGGGAIDPGSQLVMGDNPYYTMLGRPYESAAADRNWRSLSPSLNATDMTSAALMLVSQRELGIQSQVAVTFRRVRAPFEMWVFPEEDHYKNLPSHKRASAELARGWLRFWLQDGVADREEDTERWRQLLPTLEANRQRLLTGDPCRR